MTTDQGAVKRDPLLTQPVLPLLLRFAWPNMLAMLATALAAIAETTYVGSFGTAPLAAMALVFPMVMLQMMLSAGAMGGGVSSAISRAFGDEPQPGFEETIRRTEEEFDIVPVQKWIDEDDSL